MMGTVGTQHTAEHRSQPALTGKVQSQAQATRVTGAGNRRPNNRWR